MAENNPPILQMREIVKRFGETTANDHVNFDLRSGEIHALLGENGAGKTTLMNILYGLYKPDQGEILLDGQPVNISSPGDALNYGIGMVHQHFMLIDIFTAAENVTLGSWKSNELFINPQKIEVEVSQISKRFGFEFDPSAKIETLPVGIQQRVEIVKALYRGARILILDEPTAVLTPQESEELFKCMRDLTANQVSIIFISHKLEEVLQISDRVTILRNGIGVGTFHTNSLSKNQMAMLMIGRSLESLSKRSRSIQPVAIEVDNLEVFDGKVKKIKSISLSIEKGQILGVAGIDGNGQLELANAICGIRPATNGIIKMMGGEFPASQQTPSRFFDLGGAYIPQDRSHTGLVLDFTVAENLVLKKYKFPPFTHWGFLRHEEIHSNAGKLIQTFDIRPPEPDLPVRMYSGGNQQKVILARELNESPSVVVACYPTRGLDIGATEFIIKQLIYQRDQGAAILFFSNELEEIISISDLIMVIHRGEITGIVEPDEVNAESLGLLMMGQTLEKP